MAKLPVDYEAGRFFVCPVTADGMTLRLFTDTGGGLFLRASAVKRLGLATETVRIGDEEVVVVSLPEFSPDASIPPISVEHDSRPPELRGRMSVYADEDYPHPSVRDGMLGQTWFGGRVWTFDYPGRRLLVHPRSDTPVSRSGNYARLGFPTNAQGRRGSNFPSIEATIDDETHPFLFDTGATVRLSDHALNELGGGPAERATCFITAWLYERWHDRHPDWRVIDGADLNTNGEPMIEVPTMTIAGLEAGPVLFTRRADLNFHDFMSSMMDRRVEGALGGSLLEYFVITVDYPQAFAAFEHAR